MYVKCLCGHENHVEMPFDDLRTVRIQCTNACRAARELKASLKYSGQLELPFTTPMFGGAAQVIPFSARK